MWDLGLDVGLVAPVDPVHFACAKQDIEAMFILSPRTIIPSAHTEKRRSR